MRNKAPLSLMELLCMLLVFALSAALCLQVFALSARVSRKIEAQGQAVNNVQNTAELVKYCRADVSQYPKLLGGEGDAGLWRIGYDDSWQKISPDEASYIISVTPVSCDLEGLGKADISAVSAKGEELFALSVSWQEVDRG